MVLPMVVCLWSVRRTWLERSVWAVAQGLYVGNTIQRPPSGFDHFKLFSSSGKRGGDIIY